ncbi:polysaccharide biosynthesis protein [Methyloceanibacter caenitepidi]|uniref:UDP-N-acetylglucosamine 4,6-dehydratase n=1 Tax=Methyloceanibacter caenitepidi TaxID=1384459 RepID=A0A0A8K0I6_9HYPH|nr:nucleoside-diphosphate sugar epimerase/dehydratase [Methyloceanibacter caenitepidi]BAQ16395.1 UDP-N-acetylglucosamine 4,6-dehydratase [Methyloceanibacter caenitepidi]
MNFAVWLIERPRWFKRVFLIANDFAMLGIALWAAYSLRLSRIYIPDTWQTVLLLLAAPVIGVFVFYWRGLYKLVTRFIGPSGTTQIYIAVIIAAVLWALVVYLSGVKNHPRSVVVIYALIAAILIRLSRQWAGSMLLKAAPQYEPIRADVHKNVIIYGAGQAGIQLLRALNEVGTYHTVAFIDSSPSLAGQVVHGVKVIRPEKIGKVIADEKVDEVLLAAPSALRSERRVALKVLEQYPVEVKTLPALEEIASGRVEVSDLRPIDVEDLLGRDPVEPDLALLASQVRDKSVLITGAGGSIGSELTRQLLQLGPRMLILFDVSEPALYEISLELVEMQRRMRVGPGGTERQTTVVQILGSVLDRDLVRRTIDQHNVEVIYHAAAYKHVPIVEVNPAVGLQNNTFGTLVVAEAARDAGVERFVLISSDKAVRPTNVMGASKRLAELILQALAEDPHNTTFTMVRFGNVLDSSGSVVRLFRKQIKAGGPVTVTHPEVIRYFMSIPEAAQLVIQAGAMAEGGEVFVLEMGTPVKIDDLARTMIRLSGLEVQDETHPDGDVEIRYVGLRPGEKLFEELLIGEDTTGTDHPRIFKTSEPVLAYDALIAALERFEKAIANNDLTEVQAMLHATVEGYAPGSAAAAPGTDEWQPQSQTLH